MKVVLAGAYGNLGADIFKALVKAGHKVVAADMIERDLGINKKAYTFHKVDVTKPETLKGLCDGADCVITTVGLTKTSATVTNYQIDYQGNLNLLNEAKAAGVKHFTYISVLKADKAPKVPMLHANVVSTEDFAEFIVNHMTDKNKMYNVGGKETYSYEEIANMCFAAAGKEPVIKRAPAVLFDVLAFINKFKKNGKEAILRFSKWTLTEDMTGENKVGEMSFKQYIEDSFKK